MKDDVLRLFFALSCPPELAEAIATWRSSLLLHGHPIFPVRLRAEHPRHPLSAVAYLAIAARRPGLTFHTAPREPHLVSGYSLKKNLNKNAAFPWQESGIYLAWQRRTDGVRTA